MLEERVTCIMCHKSPASFIYDAESVSGYGEMFLVELDNALCLLHFQEWNPEYRLASIAEVF